MIHDAFVSLMQLPLHLIMHTLESIPDQISQVYYAMEMNRHFWTAAIPTHHSVVLPTRLEFAVKETLFQVN